MPVARSPQRDPFIAYGQSKTACSLLAVEATRRWSRDGIYANALNPGAIATNLQKHTGGLKTPPERRKNTAQGAATSVLLAASPFIEELAAVSLTTVTKRTPSLADLPTTVASPLTLLNGQMPSACGK